MLRRLIFNRSNPEKGQKVVELALQLYMAEYNALCNNALRAQNTQRQLVYTAIGGVGVGFPILFTQVDQGNRVVLLIVPILYTVLSMAYFYAGYQVFGMSEYINKFITAPVNRLLEQIGQGESPGIVLAWDQRKLTKGARFFLGLGMGAEVALLQIPGIGALVAFLLLSGSSGSSWSDLEMVMFWLAIGFYLLLGLMGLVFWRTPYEFEGIPSQEDVLKGQRLYHRNRG